MAEASEAYTLTGDVMLVERIKAPERKVGSIIMAEVKNQRTALGDGPHFVTVLAVGPGYYDDETKAPIALEAEPGDIILVGPASVKYFSFFGDLTNYEPDAIGITRATEIQMRFRGKEGYEKVFSILNGKVKTEVEQHPGLGEPVLCSSEAEQ